MWRSLTREVKNQTGLCLVPLTAPVRRTVIEICGISVLCGREETEVCTFELRGSIS